MKFMHIAGVLCSTIVAASTFAQAKRAVVSSTVSTKDEMATSAIPRFPRKDGSVFYERIDSSFKKQKDDVYKSAKIWFAETFRNSNSVLKMDDKELGELVGKGTTIIEFQYGNSELKYWSRFTIKLSCRNNKFRVQIYDIGLQPGGEQEYESVELYMTRTDAITAILLRKMDEQMSSLLSSSTSAISSRKDDF